MRRGWFALGALIVAAVVAGCATVAVDGRRLEGSTWRAVSIAGQPPAVGAEPTITFDGDRVRGSGGCNGFVGQESISIVDGHLHLGAMLMTLGACVGPNSQDLPVMATEDAFWLALSAADHIAIREGRLVISGTAGELVFERSQ